MARTAGAAFQRADALGPLAISFTAVAIAATYSADEFQQRIPIEFETTA